jgi:predicted NBD/HSP70 family sugar kinase
MNNISGRPQAMKEINCTLIKKALKRMTTATRAEISEATGISPTTVRALLDELIESSEVVRFGLDKSTGGRRAERYALNLKESLILAFYIRDKYINYAISNPLGEIMEEKSIEINDENYSENIEKIINIVLQNNNYIKAIGISVPGVVDIEKRKYSAGKSLTEWQTFNIGERIEKKYKIPVVLENDLNTIALGYSLNLMKKLDVDDLHILNMIYIHFTEAGIGAGIIANGELVRGGSNLAGELGFIPVSDGKHLQAFIEDEPDDNAYIETISMVIAAINCIINPDLVAIGGETFRVNLIDQIKERCNKYVANNVMPDIFLAKDSKVDCLTGIVHLTLRLMYSNIKLVDDKKILL